MNKLLNTASNEKKGKILYMMENLLEIGIGHSDGYTTLYLDVHDIPADLRQRIDEGDEDTLDQLETYFSDYYNNAELNSVSLVRGEDYTNSHCWEDVFSCCGALRNFIVKARGKVIRLLGAI